MKQMNYESRPRERSRVLKFDSQMDKEIVKKVVKD